MEALPKRHREGSAISGYAVEDYAYHHLGALDTQKEAIDWAKRTGHHPLVTRVRHVNDKKKRRRIRITGEVRIERGNERGRIVSGPSFRSRYSVFSGARHLATVAS